MNLYDNVDIRDGSFSSHQPGAHIYFKQIIPKKLAKPAFHFIFQHGAVTYHGSHTQLIETMLRTFGDQIVISCMDLVGHGMSGGPRAFVQNFEVYERDFLSFCHIAFERVKELELPVVIAAQSLGGMIVTKCLVDHKDKFPFPVSRVILSNPCIKPKISMPKGMVDTLGQLSDVIGKLRLPSIYDGRDLTNDAQMAIRFDHDHLNSHFMTVRMGQEILSTSQKLINLAYFVDFPVMFLTCDTDLVVDLSTTMLFMRGIKKDLVTHHSFSNTKHDLFNEVCRLDVCAKVTNYVKDVL